MKTILLSAILLITFAMRAQAPATNPVALNAEPHHHLLFENEYVRAWGFGIHGHDATLLHNHDLPYFGVALGEADYVNAVVGKPETHAKLADGQISYSKGGFAHLVRTETDTPFRNLTIELRKPQGAPRNRCVKVIADGALDCPPMPSGAMTPVMETDEVVVRTGAVASAARMDSGDAQLARLVAVLENSELSLEVAGQPAKTLHAGQAAWVPAGTAATLVNSGQGNARFMLLSFKDSAAAAK